MKHPSISSRRGSALLIVLGFLSFMVVSAVAFSIWMRTERIPSSALRRTVSVRHLAKAAMARAIAELDFAIKDNPFPGTINRDHPSPQFADANSNGYFDFWRGRDFFPPNRNILTGEDNTSSRSAGFSDTISVLTLEALGYIPAPLINEARYLGRQSWAAAWKDLDYDAGRYAYTALNVSDFLDINRIRFGRGRGADSASRISGAHLFANPGTYAVADPSAPKAFDEFIATRGGNETDIPFTSLLDYNIALGSSGVAGIESYFWKLAHGDNQTDIYNGAESNAVLRQVFITDSWYPYFTNSTAAAQLYPS